MTKLFECPHHLPFLVKYCISDKAVAASSFVMVLWCSIQIALHLHKGFVSLHLRLRILYVCFVQSLFIFFHYGMMDEEHRDKWYTISDILNFILFSMNFYYFLYKASELMSNRELVLKRIRYSTYTIVVLMVAIVPYNFVIQNELYDDTTDVPEDYNFDIIGGVYLTP